jgi:hypothetical protein
VVLRAGAKRFGALVVVRERARAGVVVHGRC